MPMPDCSRRAGHRKAPRSERPRRSLPSQLRIHASDPFVPAMGNVDHLMASCTNAYRNNSQCMSLRPADRLPTAWARGDCLHGLRSRLPNSSSHYVGAPPLEGQCSNPACRGVTIVANSLTFRATRYQLSCQYCFRPEPTSPLFQ